MAWTFETELNPCMNLQTNKLVATKRYATEIDGVRCTCFISDESDIVSIHVRLHKFVLNRDIAEIEKRDTLEETLEAATQAALEIMRTSKEKDRNNCHNQPIHA